MTTAGNFDVNPEQIRQHASTVAGVADRLSAAGKGPGELAENALGTFVQFVTAGLGDAMRQTTGAIAHASSTIDGLSATLAKTAEDYERADDDQAALLYKTGAQ